MTGMPANRSNFTHRTLGRVEDSVFAEDLNTLYSRFDIHDFFLQRYIFVRLQMMNLK